MKIRDFFDFYYQVYLSPWVDSKEILIHGWPINYGAIGKNCDLLYLNSNDYKDFIYNNFISKYEKCFDTKELANIINPKLVLYENEIGIKELKVSHIIYCRELIGMLLATKYREQEYLLELINSDYSIEHIINILKQAYQDEISIFCDVANKNEKSLYYNNINEDYKTLSNKVSFSYYIYNKIELLNQFYKSFDKLKELLSNNLNLEDFINCFDYDKLMMIIASSFIDCIDEEKEINHCYLFLKDYFEAIKSIRNIDLNYNCYIKYNRNNKIRTLNIDNLIEKYNSIKKFINEDDCITITINKEFFNKHNLDTNDIINLNPKEFKDLVIMLNNQEINEDIKEEDIKENIEELDQRITVTTDNTEKLKLIQQKEKMEFLLSNKPVKILHGTNSFSKYYGYLYDNGYVVFDVLDKKINKSYGNALYVIAYNKINEYSKKTKMELRKSDYSDMSIIMHTNNWKEKLLKILNGLNNVEVDIESINSITIDKVATIEELRELESKISNISENDIKIIKEKERRIKVYNEIDEELKNYNKEEITLEQLNSIVEELIDNNMDFEKLFYSKKNNYKRNPAVAAYTKMRSRDENGYYTCELCNAKSMHASSFDSHHMIELSNGGVDNIYNTVCLCPNCHRDFHSNRLTYNQLYELFQNIRKNIIRYNIEYLPLFNDMINPNTEDYNYYLEHKEQEDKKFLISWNYTRKLNK